MIEAATNSVLSGLSSVDTNKRVDNDAENLGMSTFLKLMTTQLRYQDPSAPQDSSQFLDQMAQFSSLSGIQSMEQSITNAVSGLQSNRLLQASNMVGKQVLVQTDLLVSEQPPSEVTGKIGLSAATANLSLAIQTESGQTVRSLNLGTQASGAHEFTWDGLDQLGNPLPAGSYRLVAKVAEPVAEQPEVALEDRVISVSVNATGAIQLNLTQSQTVGLADVLEVS